MTTMEKKLAEVKESAFRIEVLAEIYEVVERQMKWDCMCSGEETDENGNLVYESYAKKYQDVEPDSYEGRMIKKEKIWNEVLKAIEKLADK